MKTAVQAMQLGASDFLEKPFTPEDLRLSIAAVLQERDAQREGEQSDIVQNDRRPNPPGVI
jgi:DNA-binding NtrC family response regulator